MSTAAELREAEMQKDIAYRRFEHFIRRWAPKNAEDRQFEADLFVLISAVYAEADKPYRRMIEASLYGNFVVGFKKKTDADPDQS